MAKVLVTENYLSAIGDAIRGKLGGSTQYTPGQMASAISSIPTEAATLISKSIVANGTYNASSDEADGYDSVSVNVPNSYASGDEGKVVNNGGLVAQESQSVSQNGTYNTTLKNQVVVSVPNTYEVSDNGKVVVNQALVAQTSKNINTNGTHDTTSNNSVVVNVPNSYSASDEGKVVSSGELVAQTSRNVTQNGTYDTTENNEVVVNVSGGGGGTLIQKTITQNGTYNASDDNADGYSSVTVNVSGGDNDEILYNPDFSKNTTGQTSWDGTNSGTSQSSRFRIIDGWEIMQCTAEKTANGLKVVPKKQYAYLTATIPAYWFLNKTVTIYAIVNGTKYEMSGALSSNGASVSYNTPFGQLYFYAYNSGDTVFTLSFNNQINQEFVISDTSMKLSTSSS